MTALKRKGRGKCAQTKYRNYDSMMFSSKWVMGISPRYENLVRRLLVRKRGVKRHHSHRISVGRERKSEREREREKERKSEKRRV